MKQDIFAKEYVKHLETLGMEQIINEAQTQNRPSGVQPQPTAVANANDARSRGNTMDNSAFLLSSSAPVSRQLMTAANQKQPQQPQTNRPYKPPKYYLHKVML